MERRPPDLSARLGEALQGLKEAKRRREEQRQRRDARIRGERQGDPGRGGGQASEGGPGPDPGSGDESQGPSRRDTSPRGEGAAASDSGHSAVPPHYVLVSYGRSEWEGIGAAPDESRRSVPGQLPRKAEGARPGEASGAGPGGEVEGVGSGEEWECRGGRGEQGRRFFRPAGPSEGLRSGEGGAGSPSWHGTSGLSAAQAQGPQSSGAEDEAASQWQSWRGVESSGASPSRPQFPSSGDRAQGRSPSAWHSRQQRGLVGLGETGGRGGEAEGGEGGEGGINSEQATDGTFAPARPPRSLQISPMSVGSFAPMARTLSGADMMACLQALCSAVEAENTAQVRRLEREIRFASSPIGNAVQRMGLLFLRGLKLRASLGTQRLALPQLNAQLSTSSPKISPAALASLASYFKRVPLSGIVLASACAALLDALSNHDRIHFLCLAYNQLVGCHHWVSLIQGLGTRPQGPPKGVRFTFVACTSFMAAVEVRELQQWIKGVGRQLEAEASRWGIRSFEVEYAEIGDTGLQGLAAVRGRTAPGAVRKRTAAGTAPAVNEEAESAGTSGSAREGPGTARSESTWPTARGRPVAVKEERSEGQMELSLGPSPLGGPQVPAPAQGAGDAFSKGSPSFPQRGQGQQEPLAYPGPAILEADAESGGQEGLCVCTLMSLYNLVDDSRLTPNPRQAVMEWVRSLAPDLFLVAEMPVDQASGSPDTRFKQCVQYYAPLLDLHDAVMKQERAQGTGPGKGKGRGQRQGSRGSGAGTGTGTGAWAGAGAGAGPGAGVGAGAGAGGDEEGIFHFEQCFLGRHVNKCIGPMKGKLIHTPSMEAWQAHMASLGYAEALWEGPTQDFVRRCIQGLPTDLHIRFSGGTVTFLWRGQVLYFVGKWGLSPV